MENKITHIEFVLENCEYFSVPIEKITCVSIWDLRKNLNINFMDDILHSYEYAGNTSIRFKMLPNEKILTHPFETEETISDLLERKDIAQIHFKDNDKTIRWVFTEWGDEEYINENQRFVVTPSCTHLYIGTDEEMWEKYCKTNSTRNKELLKTLKISK